MRFLGVRNPFCSNILPCKIKGFLLGFAPSGVCCALPSRCNARSVRLEALVGSQSILIGGGSREPLCGPSTSFFLNTTIGIGGPLVSPCHGRWFKASFRESDTETCAPR